MESNPLVGLLRFALLCTLNVTQPSPIYIHLKIFAMELLNIRFHFLCRSTYANSDGHSPIVLRVIFRGQRKDIFTGLYCDVQDWDPTSQQVFNAEKNSTTINKNLELIARKAHGCFEQLKYSGATFSLDELIDKIKDREEAPVLLVEYIEQCNSRISRRVNVDISKGTFVKYRTCLKPLV
jgi:hypothetical protein